MNVELDTLQGLTFQKCLGPSKSPPPLSLSLSLSLSLALFFQLLFNYWHKMATIPHVSCLPAIVSQMSYKWWKTKISLQ